MFCFLFSLAISLSLFLCSSLALYLRITYALLFIIASKFSFIFKKETEMFPNPVRCFLCVFADSILRRLMYYYFFSVSFFFFHVVFIEHFDFPCDLIPHLHIYHLCSVSFSFVLLLNAFPEFGRLLFHWAGIITLDGSFISSD